MADELVKKRITEYGTEVTPDDLDNSDVIFVDSTQHGTRKLRLKGIRDIISSIQNEGIKSSGVSVTADNYATTITDVNNQPVNTIYAYAAGLQSSIANLPSNNALSILHYTFKYSVSTNVGQVMIAIERSGENPAMYFRSTSGTPVTWGSWIKMANNADVEAIREELDNLDIETDKTLSIDGKPADAKAVGDEISDIKEDLSASYIAANANSVSFVINNWLNGGINPATGAGNSSASYIKTSKKWSYNDISYIEANDGYNFEVFVWDSNDAYVGIVAADGKNVLTNATSLRALEYCDLAYIEALYPNMQFNISVWNTDKTSIDKSIGESTVVMHRLSTYGLNEMKINKIQSLISWEYGDIAFSDNGPYHIGLRSPIYRYRVRTPINATVYLKPGDTIFVPSGKQIMYGYTDANGNYTRLKSWIVGERIITIAVAGNYDLLLTNTTASEIVDINSFVSDVVITTNAHSITDLILSTKVYTNIPNHFKESLQTLINTKKQRELISDGNGDSFIFITDVHWQQNTQNSPALIGEILRKTNTKMVVFGGDILNLGATQEYGITVERKFFEALDAEGIIDNLYSVIGNHDWNDNVSSTYPDAHLDNYAVYSLMYKQIEDHVKELPKISGTDYTNSFYYYVDNENQKIRYIFINDAKASLGETQTAWIRSKISELSNEWTIVCFAHMYWATISGTTPNVTAVGTELKNLLDNLADTANAKIACLIVGHCHYDYSVKSDAGYWIIATTTDCLGQSTTSLSPTMTMGTETEQSFDIFTLDVHNKTVYADRLGAGNERSRTFIYQ